MLYFLYHGFFFLAFAAQNYYIDDWNDNFQFSFLILVIFYGHFLIEALCLLRKKQELHKYGRWMRQRLYLQCVEYGFMMVMMLLIPFYLQNAGINDVPGWTLLILAGFAGFINLFIIKHE